jgi:hypothetical protein
MFFVNDKFKSEGGLVDAPSTIYHKICLDSQNTPIKEFRERMYEVCMSRGRYTLVDEVLERM